MNIELILNPEPSCRLVRFLATDLVELGGLLYEPEQPSKLAVLFLHGTGGASIFDTNRTNLLAAQFVEHGMAFFPFNNRGAHITRRLKMHRGKKAKSISGGSAHELIRDCVPDIDGAIDMLRGRGYEEFAAIGHSTGANKLAVYDSRKKRHAIRKFVFLAGGDDTGLLYHTLGARRFHAALEKGRERIRERRGGELVPPSLYPIPISWKSFVDMANPDGDYNVFPFLEAMTDVRLGRKPLWRHLRAISKPSYFVYGDRDGYCYDDVAACVSVLAQAVGRNRRAEIAVVREADHGFSGFESGLGALMAQWIQRS